MTEAGEVKRDGYRIRKLVFETEPGVQVPGLLFDGGRGPLVIYADNWMVYGTFSLGTKYDYDSDTKVSCSTLAAAPSATTRPIALGRTSPRNVGSTAAIGTIEFEPGLQGDLPELLDRLIPPSTDYGHEQAWHDGNGHSHLQATLLGPALSVPVSGGRLALGTWQQIFHLECDVRPRQRTLVVTVLG